MGIAEDFISTARGIINSLKNKFNIADQIEHRNLLILCTDAVELALKALLLKRFKWTKDDTKRKIRHRLAKVFEYIPAPTHIMSQVDKFDNKNWSWERRYPELCYAAETTSIFPEDPVPVAEEILRWAEIEFDK